MIALLVGISRLSLLSHDPSRSQAVSAMIDAYLDPLAFAALPTLPCNFRAYACEAKIRSAVEGVLKEIDQAALKQIRGCAAVREATL